MVKNKLYFLIVVMVLFSVACSKKELPTPRNGSPVFFFKGEANGQKVEMNAGVEDYYLTTSYSSADSVYGFSGLLSKQNCTAGCPPSLKITVFDKEKRTGSISDIADVLKNGSYSFFSQTDSTRDSVKVFTFMGPEGYAQYLWEFGDGAVSTEQNPEYEFTDNGKHLICLTVTSSTGCKRTMCNLINTDVNEPASFSYSLNSNNVITLTGPAGWDKYNWSFSDSTVAVSQNVVHAYVPMELYDVCLTARKGNDVATFCRQIAVPESNSCAADWAYTYRTEYRQTAPSRFSKVLIEWTDATGNKFTSELQYQPVSSFFKIIKGADYINNEQGLATYSYDCEFDVVLYGQSTSLGTVHLTSNNCKWAVAYP